jgi:hypothetical protein
MRPAFACLIFLSGCTHLQLERSSVNQASTLTDMQFQQVMDNLAMFVANPKTIPWHVVPVVGTAQVQDGGQISPGLTFIPNVAPALSQTLLGLQGSRQIQESWTLVPAIYNTLEPDPAKPPHIVTFAIRDIYRYTVGETTDYTPNLANYIKTYGLQPGWYGIGKRRDVPHNACFVSHCKECYVWVTPENFEGLANLTLAVLDVAHARAGTITFNRAATGAGQLPLAVPTATPVIPPPPILSAPMATPRR